MSSKSPSNINNLQESENEPLKNEQNESTNNINNNNENQKNIKSESEALILNKFSLYETKTVMYFYIIHNIFFKN